MLALYGHHFSSYTWKALIPFYAYDIPFDFRIVDPDHAENSAVVAGASPHGKFPLLDDGGKLVFESSTIIEHLDRHHVKGGKLLPTEPEAAIRARQLDRVFDHYVMNTMQDVVNEYLRPEADRDMSRIAPVHERLQRSYAWIEDWLETYERPDHVTLVECAAAPSLFYSDWVYQITDEFPRLKAWRAHLLALPSVKRCVDDARPFRPFFPLGAPDRD